MTVGQASTFAASRLNVYRATSHTSVSPFLKLHTGDPGSAGTANASAVTARNAITFAAPSAGSMALSSIGTYGMTTTETISHGSIWDASTAGNFQESFAFASGVPVINGSTLTISTLTVTEAPIAA
jgi:hypothetical protein